MIDFLFYVNADYKPEHQTNGVIGYGIVADSKAEADKIRERMLADSKVESVRIRPRRIR